MGVDYEARGGIGILVSEEEIVKAFKLEVDDDTYFEEVFENTEFAETAQIIRFGDNYIDNGVEYALVARGDVFANGLEQAFFKLRNFDDLLKEHGLADYKVGVIKELYIS